MKILISMFILFLSIQWLYSQRDSVEHQKIFIPPSKKVKTYSFGYDQMIASLMWVRVLQDIEVCDQTDRKTSLPELTNNEDALDEVLTRKLPKSRCEDGWVFQMLDVITDLDPHFEGAYKDGATFLSVLVDDRQGAHKIFKKAIKQYPKDWNILYRAAYHELFEMQNPETSSQLLRQAGENGAPDWVYSLSAKIYTKMGQAAFAKTILESVIERKPNAEYIERIKGQLEKINEVLGTPAQ